MKTILLKLAVLAFACASTRLIAQAPAKSASTEIAGLEAAVRRSPFDLKLRYQLGIAYLDKEDFPRATEVFAEAVKLAPGSGEAHNWLGVALMGKSELPGAVAELRKAVSLDPKYARAYNNLGSALARSGESAQAVEAFQKALALEPDSLPARLNLALALREKGDLKAALLHLRGVANAQPKNAVVQYELGQTLRQSGDLANAIKAFERAVEINPELQEGYYGLGLALKQQSARMQRPRMPPASEPLRRAQDAASKGDLNSARDLLLSVVEKDDTDAEAHDLLGYILGQQGQLEFAMNHLQRAVQLKPDYADAHYNLGVTSWYSGFRQRAIAELEESVRLDPALGGAHAFLGMAMREQSDLSGARASLQRAIALLPPTTATYVDLAIVFLQQGDLDRALGQLEAGLHAPSSVPAADWEGAVAGLRQALTKDPSRADGYNMLGLLLGRKGAARDEVLAEFREAIRLRPDYAIAHNNMGLVLAQSDEDEKAVLEFREAIRIRPDYADAHANLGATLLAADVAQAIPELEKAVSLNPSSVSAQFNLAEAYGTSPSHGPAKQIEQLRKVIALSSSFARAHLALGKALVQTGKADEAVAELREAVRLDPQSGESHYQLGLALARAGKQPEATIEVEKGRELSAAGERNQNAALDLSEGRAALDKGELEQAAAKFRHALKLQPDSAPAEHFLGVVLEKQGDASAAADAYRAALNLNPGDMASRQALERLALPDTPRAAAEPPNEQTGSKIQVIGSDDGATLAELEGYIRQGRFQEVEPRLADYVKQHPKSDWGWYALGYSQFAQKKIGESIKSLANSLQLNIKNAEAHKILGRDLMIIGRFDAAQTEFEQGIRYAATSAEMHYDLGKLFSMQDNWQGARKEFETALTLNASYIEALDALGFAQEALGDDAAAVATYQKAIALNEERHGTFVEPYVNLSGYYNRTGDTAKALEFAQKALDLNPRSDAAWFQRGRAQERQGQLDQAAGSLNRAIALNGRSSTYYYVLAGVYRRLGKAEERQKALDAFSRLDRENNQLEKVRRGTPRTLERPGGGRE